MSYTLDEALLRGLVVHWLWHEQGGWLLGAAIGALLLLAGVLAFGLSAALAFCLGVLACYLALLAVSLWQGVAAQRRYLDLPMVVHINERGFDSSCALSESHTPWSEVRRLKESGGLLILELRAWRGRLAVPRAALDPELTAFLREQVRSAGGCVVGGA